MSGTENQVNPAVQVIVSRTEKPNSFEFGEAKKRFKIYFDNADDALPLMLDCKKIEQKRAELFGGDDQ